MRIEDILHSSVALERIQKQKQADVKGSVQRLRRESRDEVGVVRQTDEQIMAIRDREQSFMRHEIMVSGLELLKKRVAEFARTPVEQRNYQVFSQELQQMVNGVRFQGETPLAYMSVRVSDERSLYTLSQQIDQEIAVHQGRLRQERKQIASFLVKQENQEALVGRSSEALVADLKQTLEREGAYPLKKDYSFAQIVKIL